MLRASVFAGKISFSWMTPRAVYSRSWSALPASIVTVSMGSIVTFCWTGKIWTKASCRLIAFAPEEVKVYLCLTSDPPNSLSVAPNSLLEAHGRGGRRLLGHESSCCESFQLRFRGNCFRVRRCHFNGSLAWGFVRAWKLSSEIDSDVNFMCKNKLICVKHHKNITLMSSCKILISSLKLQFCC